LIAGFDSLVKLTKSGYTVDEALVPVTNNVLNQRYLKNKNSFMQNIPKPEVITLARHGYVSLKSCVADFLARHEFNFDELIDAKNSCIRRISQCRQAQEMLESVKSLSKNWIEPEVKRLILFLIEWSDDFDPAKSIKDNRGSAWMKSITISPLHSSSEEFSNTYPIAIGRKADSHDAVEEEFAQDLQDLRSGNLQFRVGKYGILVYVYADILASLQDQIERRSSNCVMLGSSTHSARWGHVCDISAISGQLPSCQTCWTSLSSDIATSSTCHGKSCLNWDTLNSSYKKPKLYPKDIDVGENDLISSKRLSYVTLCAAVEKTIDSMTRQDRRQRWNKTTASCYLSSEGINGDLIEKVAEYAKRRLQATDRNVSELPTWSNPIFWRRGVSLASHIDVPMHLIFLGIVKATVGTINEWCSKYGWNLIVDSRTNISLDTIKKLNLNWCRSIPLWKSANTRELSTSGWVSENYLAMARLLVWYYTDFISTVLAEDSEEYIKVAMLLTSLRAMVSRVMTRVVDDDIIEDIRRHIKIFLQCFHDFTKENSQPVDMPKPKHSGRKRKRSCKEKKNCDQSTSTRQKKADNQGEQCHHDSAVNTESDSQPRSRKVIPPWLSKYNFVCLLNVPDVMQQFGPIRNYWEGGKLGEKILQVAKGTWYGFTKNWAPNMLRGMINTFCLKKTVGDLNARVFDNMNYDDDEKASSGVDIIDNDDKEPNECLHESITTNYDRANYRLYQSSEQVQSSFDSLIPISVIILKNDLGVDIGIAIKGHQFISVNIHVDDVVKKISHSYFKCSLGECRKLDLTEGNIQAYALMLPLYYKDDNNSIPSDRVKWTIVSSEWEDFLSTGMFGSPCVFNCGYIRALPYRNYNCSTST
jgi:hypothetical protein